MRTPSIDREALLARLLELGLAGETPNLPEANLRAIRAMLDGNVFYTFGITAVREALARGDWDEERILVLMAEACGQRDGREFLAGPGRIDPRKTLAGLERGAERLRAVISRRGTVAFGTGHPGAMLNAYNRLADQLEGLGCRIATIPPGAPVGVDWVLDFVGRVAVTSDTCGVLHGHSTRPMEQFLAAYPEGIDLVIGDHGHAGAAVNAGIPTLAFMDTNDPALAVAERIGAGELVVIPLFDNRPNAVTVALADMWLSLVALAEPHQEGYDGGGPRDARHRPIRQLEAP